jgi:hypothetical protein
VPVEHEPAIPHCRRRKLWRQERQRLPPTGGEHHRVGGDAIAARKQYLVAVTEGHDRVVP